ncbi:MAG: hypothetical protein KatS3mg061_0666 [Dehalococcoidia bacterium]|nr:MAG: hypothetical protein KatS3mg061_0666 [Dehalococcoidia bacterium]
MEHLSIRQQLEVLAANHGPLEVAVILAPEEFVPEPGMRRLAGAWALQLGVVSMKQPRQSEGDPLENIGSLTLVLTPQTAQALHSFLTSLLQPGQFPRRPRRTVASELPVVDPPPDEG